MDVFLVRHAIAEPRDYERWPDDCLRPLSAGGIELFRQAARGLRSLAIEVDAVLTSPCVRAVQTAQVLAEEAGWPIAESCEALEPTARASAAERTLEARAEASLAVVGHQPELAELASLLLTGDEQALALELKKGSVACIRFVGRPARNAGVLRWSVSPKFLRRLGRSAGD